MVGKRGRAASVTRRFNGGTEKNVCAGVGGATRRVKPSGDKPRVMAKKLITWRRILGSSMIGFGSRGHLLRLLGATFGVAVGVGEMIGSGILRSPSVVAASLHDSGIIILLWSFGALHALL